VRREALVREEGVRREVLLRSRDARVKTKGRRSSGGANAEWGRGLSVAGKGRGGEWVRVFLCIYNQR
jgi:hypothetical protein